MNYLAQLKRIRRFLRDPNGNIWEDDYLRTSFNDIQRELNHGTKVLEDVDILRNPPQYHMSYMFDFEYTGTKKYYRAKIFNHGVCADHEWEIQSYLGYSGLSETGSRVFHPWEAWITAPNDVIPLQLPDDLHNIKFLAYDNEPIGYIEKKFITNRDSTYKTREGEPIGYYREDELERDFIPYPRPSSVTWNDLEDITIPDFIYTFDFESNLLSGTGNLWVFEKTDYKYLFVWEETLDLREDGIRGMYPFERDYTLGGQVVYVSGDTGEAFGTITQRPGLFSQDEGTTFDVLDQDDNFLVIFDCDPKEIQGYQDESAFPVYLRKYIECGVLQRAYNSNTDGRIRSLSEYWGLRYELGIQAIKKFKGLRKQDRDYRFITSQRQPSRKFRHPRLPDGYPAC